MVVKQDLHSRRTRTRKGSKADEEIIIVRRKPNADARGADRTGSRNAAPGAEATAEASADELMKAMLSIVDASIDALERTAWEARNVADEAVDLWRTLESGSGDVAAETQALARDASRWPRRLRRLAGTGWMLTRVAASYRLWETRRAFLPADRFAEARDELHRRNARRFRDTSLRHGGAFLKIGQLLSCRPDLLPKPWIEELAMLQDQASPIRFSAVRRALEEEFGKPMDELFAAFDEQPLACASIGQVHRATLHDGRDVAVKVQRPDLDEAIELDMKLMRIFLDGMRSMLPPTDLNVITDEIERAVREELDYEAEARWVTRARDFLAHKPGLIVPETIPGLCSRHVLTTRFVEGRKMTRVLDELHEAGDGTQVGDILGRLLDSYFTQVLDAGFFQADPHPGNILVTPEGDLVLLDFGCTMELPENYRLGYKRVLQAAMVGDREVIAKTLGELGFVTRSGKPDTLLIFADALLEHIRDAATSGQGVSWPSAEEMSARSKRMMGSANEDPVDKLPPEFIMLARVFGSLGGLFMHYKPQMNVARHIIPHVMPSPVAA